MGRKMGSPCSLALLRRSDAWCLVGWISYSTGGPRALVHVGGENICAALSAILSDNLPRSGGRYVGIGLKLTSQG